MAVNALLYSWMAGDKFLPTLPLEVKQVIANASRWLAQNVKTGKTYNVVFSGSVKLGAVSLMGDESTNNIIMCMWR